MPDEFAPPGQESGPYEGVRYDEYWKRPDRVRHDSLEKDLISEMVPVNGRRIIDLGYGHGRLEPYYLDRFDTVRPRGGRRSGRAGIANQTEDKVMADLIPVLRPAEARLPRTRNERHTRGAS